MQIIYLDSQYLYSFYDTHVPFGESEVLMVLVCQTIPRVFLV